MLAFRRDLDGHPAILAAFNLGTEAVTFDWPEAAAAANLDGHGLDGGAQGSSLTLPAHGGWFGTLD